jgi:hypothetical protein
MPHSIHLKLGLIIALYLFWLVAWLVLGPESFGPACYSWDAILATTVVAGAAFRAARRTAGPYPLLLGPLGAGFVLLVLSWLTYDPANIHGLFRFPGPGGPEYSSISYALCVFLWFCGWGSLALEQWRTRPPSLLTGAVFALLAVGLAAILTKFYYPLYAASLDTISGRLDAATAGLEFATLVMGLGGILLGGSAILGWLLFAKALLMAADIAYAAAYVPAAIKPVWMFGNALLLCILIALPRTAAARPAAASDTAAEQRRSGLSGLLILLSLGAVMLSAAVWMVPVNPVWKAFLSVLFIVALVVVLVRTTDWVDATVEYLKAFAARLHCNRFEAGDWREAAPEIRAILEATGLGDYLDALRHSALRLRQDLIFLGPERLFPTPKPLAGGGAVRCFLVMPFSLEWSADVHRALVRACEAAGVQAIRGDDVFTPTDILDDIWQSLNRADFIIADITGRNANVLYELGIAHTLAKPVLILSRNASDIPIDLSTRRVILYGQSAGDWREDLTLKVSRAIVEILATYGLATAWTKAGEPALPAEASAGEAQAPMEAEAGRTENLPELPDVAVAG